MGHRTPGQGANNRIKPLHPNRVEQRDGPEFQTSGTHGNLRQTDTIGEPEHQQVADLAPAGLLSRTTREERVAPCELSAVQWAIEQAPSP